jgi:ribosome maturation factor RimP
MILKEVVNQIVTEKLNNTDCFLISAEVSQNNEIVVVIDSDSRVDLDFCVELSRYIEVALDREKEDFELEVGSFGISKPFAVVRQYTKNIGKEVEVLSKKNGKIRGILKEVCPDYFSVERDISVKIEGKKRKELQKQTVNFNYSDIIYTQLYVKI